MPSRPFRVFIFLSRVGDILNSLRRLSGVFFAPTPEGHSETIPVSYVAQDNTPPGPILKARLLRIRIDVDINQTGCRWKDLANIFPKTCLLVLESCWVCGVTEL